MPKTATATRHRVSRGRGDETTMLCRVLLALVHVARLPQNEKRDLEVAVLDILRRRNQLPCLEDTQAESDGPDAPPE